MPCWDHAKEARSIRFGLFFGGATSPFAVTDDDGMAKGRFQSRGEIFRRGGMVKGGFQSRGAEFCHDGMVKAGFQSRSAREHG